MKLMIAVIQNEDEDALVQALEDNQIASTRIGTSGGFLRASNVTIMMAVQAELVDVVLGLLKQHCKRRTRHLYPLLPNLEARERFLGSIPVEVGGAIVFILPIEQIVKID